MSLPLLFVLFVPILSLFLASYAGTQATAGPGYFRTELAFQHTAKLGGCAVGDVDPRHPGEEIVTVSITGEIFVIHIEGGQWRSELVFRCPGEALQCAIGDALPTQKGNELLVVGMAKGTEDDAGPGAAHLIHWNGESWQGSKIHEEPGPIHGGAIGHGRVVLVGSKRRAISLRAQGDGLAVDQSFTLPVSGDGKEVVLDGAGFAIGCSSGVLLWSDFQPSVGGQEPALWEIDSAAFGRARLASAGGEMLLSADDDGGLRLFAGKESRRVYQGEQKLRGAAFGPFVPDHPVHGPQLATAGYAGKVVVLLPRKDGDYRPLVLYEGPERFHDLAAGSLGERPGRALVACGDGGRVLVFRWVH